jgi:hypothetical protein
MCGGRFLEGFSVGAGVAQTADALSSSQPFFAFQLFVGLARGIWVWFPFVPGSSCSFSICKAICILKGEVE